MATVFTMIMNGDLPGRFIYRDELCAAFLTIEPITPGHTLVVPVEEVDHWIDLEPELAGHLMQVAQRVAAAIDRVFAAKKVALLIAGLEVPHTHLHLVAIDSEADLSFSLADRNPDPAELDKAARHIRDALDV